MSEVAMLAEARARAALTQRTIRQTVTLDGVGLHTGAPVQVRLEAAAPGSGIVFVRRDRPGTAPIAAVVDAVSDTRRGVTLGGGEGVTVATVEHLLSAAAGLGIDNLRVDLDGPELPALDGSAAGFVRALEEAGAVEQKVAARVIVLGVTEVAEGRGRAGTRPAEEFRVTYTVDLPAPLGEQSASAGLDAYHEAVAPARTWGFAEEGAALRARGLARGAGLENVLVIGPGGYLTPPRFPDEPARHKILDVIGDLALLGARLRGHVEVAYGGHALHLALAREIVRRWGETRQEMGEG
ncbi:MAG: UDP-3-O-[3-hydroxymyristoyl] N-acetylglucosamine deacetylase [Armatimonadetes bacterium]|nr:UDP-3-O-[3-hydroxymyristoyl] N-acetylglucosamine deacetylase [Armatimonadota bacterium]